MTQSDRVKWKMIQVSLKLQEEKNALINYANPRKYTEKLDQRLKPLDIVFFVSHVMIIMSITLSVSSVNKYTQIIRTKTKI